MVASPDNFPLLKELLAEQQRLATPVARFAELHATHSAAGPALAPVYRDLIPLSAPKAGEQYAFEVALDSCTGCKACVSACHSLNGLDDQETWRDVGVVVGGEERHPFQQTVTTACHHCADPACLNGCPVLAYEKDPVTGIVRHLDDQCIGCQYCILKCPYDVPKYNARLGIVRKCDLCHSRLAEGEAPACVQACPTHAIRIITVPLAPEPPKSVTYYVTLPNQPARVDTTSFLTAAPSPEYTQPTTRYVSKRALPAGLSAGDANSLKPQPAHWPLALMLTLMPLAVGCHVAAALLALSGGPFDTYYVSNGAAFSKWGGVQSVTYYVTLCGWLAGAMGLGASVAHLGQPWRAWRIFLGWRRSWLSREAMLFGAWFGAATAAVFVPLVEKSWAGAARLGATPMALSVLTASLGVVGLFCSVMIYVDTRRVFWRMAQTLPRFFGSAWVLGTSALFALGWAPTKAAWLLGLGMIVKLAFEARAVRPASDAEDDAPPSARLNTARLLLGPLAWAWGCRVLGAIVFSGLLPAMALATGATASIRWLIFAGVLLGELTERHLFFRAVDAPKMPGFPAAIPRKGGIYR